MKKGKSRKDLAENLLTQKLIPLEDRLFLPVFAAAVLIFLGLSIFLQEFPTIDGIHRERIALMTGENWHLKNGSSPREAQAIPLKSLKDLENVEPYSIVTLKTELLPEFTKGSGGTESFHQLSSEEFYFATFQKTPDEIKYFAVPFSAIAYPTGKVIPLPAALMTVAISLAGLILAVRLICRRYVFSHLDIITKTIFARKVFYATGGIALDSSGREIDGRLHIIHLAWHRVKTIFLTLFHLSDIEKPALDDTSDSRKSMDEKLQPVTIERIPEAPRIPPENFRNDEIGQIAATLEESYSRHERHQKVLSDLIEAIPCPVLVLEKEGKLFNANSLFLEQQGISREKLVSVEGSETRSLLENHLYFPESLSKRIAQILEQTAPRIIGKEFEFVTPRGSKVQRVSASTISNYGRRLGIIVLEGGNSLSAQQLYEIVSEMSFQQLAALERVNSSVKKLERMEREIAYKACESLIDSVNALVDLTNMNREGNRKSYLEFNLISFFRNIPSRLTNTSAVEISLSKDLPLFVQGNPMHLRQCIKAIVESYYQLNSQIKLKIATTLIPEKNEINVSFESATGEFLDKDGRKELFLQRLASTFRFGRTEKKVGANNVYFELTFPFKTAESRSNFIAFGPMEKLTSKSVLFLFMGEAPSQDDLKVFDQMSTSKKIFSSFKVCPDISKLKGIDSIVVFSEEPSWKFDEKLKGLLRDWKEARISALLVSSQPRRGESRDAAELGFSGYLSKPFRTEELEGILVILSDVDAQSLVQLRGPITRHFLEEIQQDNGNVLLTSFEPRDHIAMERLQANLVRMGFQVTATQSPNPFFESLFQNEYSFVFFPINASSGLKRRLTLALRNKIGVAYESHEANSSVETLEADHPARHVIHNPDDAGEITRILQNARLKWVEEEIPPKRENVSGAA